MLATPIQEFYYKALNNPNKNINTIEIQNPIFYNIKFLYIPKEFG